MPYKEPKSPEAIASKKDSAARYYRANPESYRKRALGHKAQAREYIREQKNKPCFDCRQSHPHYVMQFDHTGTDKLYNVADMVTRGLSISKIASEIEKCELVCANCHAIRTWSRLYPATE